MTYAVSVLFIRNPGPQHDTGQAYPATVAQDRSASGVSIAIAPSVLGRSIKTTWLPKLPCEWWFLPWMSAANRTELEVREARSWSTSAKVLALRATQERGDLL